MLVSVDKGNEKKKEKWLTVYTWSLTFKEF